MEELKGIERDGRDEFVNRRLNGFWPGGDYDRI